MNSLVEKNKSLKCGFVIKLLSIIALVCAVLSSVSCFFYYDFVDMKLAVMFPHVMALISLILSIAPIVLFVLYIFKYHNKLKAAVLVPVIFGVLAFKNVFDLLTGAPHFQYYYGYYSHFRGDFGYIISRILDLIQLLVLPACILALISALKGFNKKIYVIIAMSVCLLFEALILVNEFSSMPWYIVYSIYFYIFASLLSIFGYISFYVALLLFATKNRIPAIISASAKKKNAQSINSEQALRALKDKFDFGMITEEEYQAQRAEIISKL